MSTEQQLHENRANLIQTLDVPSYLNKFKEIWYGDDEDKPAPAYFKFLGTNQFVPIWNELLSVDTNIIKIYNEDPQIDPKNQYKHDSILDPFVGTIKPIPEKSKALYESYVTQRKQFWVDTQIDFSEDAITFNALSKEKQYSIKGVLAFFAQSDEIVCDTIEDSFLPFIEDPIVKLSYKFKAMMEDIHSLTYQTNLEMLIQDPKERADLLNSVNDVKVFPSVKLKADWARKWGSTQIPLAYRIFAQACTEGIQFSGSFMFIDYLEHAGIKLPGTQAANNLISRDEGLHTYDAGLIYKQLEYVVPPNDAFKIVQECVDTEIQFMRDIIGDRFNDLKMSDIITHIKYTANIVVSELLGYSEPYPGVRCPFEFMQGRDLATVLNFFEVKNSGDYHHADLKLDDADFEPAQSVEKFQAEDPDQIRGYFAL